MPARTESPRLRTCCAALMKSSPGLRSTCSRFTPSAHLVLGSNPSSPAAKRLACSAGGTALGSDFADCTAGSRHRRGLERERHSSMILKPLSACSGDCGEVRDPWDEWRRARALSLVTNTRLPRRCPRHSAIPSRASTPRHSDLGTVARRIASGCSDWRHVLEGESAAIICPACRWSSSWQGSPASVRARFSPAPRIALARPLP
jgi:hypothetical protein